MAHTAGEEHGIIFYTVEDKTLKDACTAIVVVKHFVDPAIPVGWSSMMALQLVLGGIILLVLGLAGEYIGRIYMCINASPQYVERQVVRKKD